MLSMKKPKSILGLDIGNKITKFAQVKFTGGTKPILEVCTMMPSGFLDEGFDTNLRTFIKENKISNPLVAASMDHPSIKIRKVELPRMPEAELMEAIKWDLRDIVEGEIDDYTVNFSKIPAASEEAELLQFVAYAVKKVAVSDFQMRLQALGLDPFFIEPMTVSLASSLDRCHSSEGIYIAGVDIGYKNTFFYVIGNKTFVFSRPLLGLNLELHQKEQETFYQKLGFEIQKSIDTFKVGFKMQEINQIYLSGGGSLLPDISQYLTQNLGLQSEILNPFASFGNADTINKDFQPPLFAQAIGLAYIQS